MRVFQHEIGIYINKRHLVLGGSGCNTALKLIEGTAVNQLPLPHAVRGYLTTKSFIGSCSEEIQARLYPIVERCVKKKF